MTTEILGPFLTLDCVDDAKMHLAAVFIAPEGHAVAPLMIEGHIAPAEPLAEIGKMQVCRARFEVPVAQNAGYDWNGTHHALASSISDDLRVAFVSCNGEEHGDLERDPLERNAMWAQLGEQHRAAPFALLLHGGDQIYADEITKGHPLSAEWPEDVPSDPMRADLKDLADYLREQFMQRYISLWADPHYSWLVARVPSATQWDDHDICDGWGSLPRDVTYSPVGQTLFDVAREMTMLFQHGAVDGDLPPRFEDRKGLHLGWCLNLPGLRVIAPDLRGERTRRQVMGEGGWRMMDKLAKQAGPARTLLVSSVPLLGPRLSILEALMVMIPKMQKYEDDLRDQWQSRAHRSEWQRMLRLVSGMMRGQENTVTVLSGELHLATRATMKVERGRVLQQLVSSAVAHRPPPRQWARALGALSTLGESPLPGQPIATRRIPGQKTRYVNDRNTLVLTRKGAHWQAQWLFETHGLSPALTI